MCGWIQFSIDNNVSWIDLHNHVERRVTMEVAIYSRIVIYLMLYMR